MDHSSTDDASMSSGAMAREIVIEHGRYSDKAFIDAMVPHHRSAIGMVSVALQETDNARIKEIARAIVDVQKEIAQMLRWREEWHLQG